jgi:hypothetical protein
MNSGVDGAMPPIKSTVHGADNGRTTPVEACDLWMLSYPRLGACDDDGGWAIIDRFRIPGSLDDGSIFPTLMSAFTSSRQANSWLSFKRVFRAVLGRAGGAAVVTTVGSYSDARIGTA